MFKVSMTLIFTFVILGCSEAPTFDESKSNFYINRASFDKLSDTVCKLAQNEYAFGDNVDRFTYNPKKIKQEYRNRELDNLLSNIGAYGIRYEKTKSGKCSFVVGVYYRGFAGSGVSYNYSFQIDVVHLYDKEKHTYEKIIKLGQDVIFDMPLESQWYFTFKYS